MPVSPSDTVVPAPRRSGVASDIASPASGGGDALTVEVVGSLDVLSAPGWTEVLIQAVRTVTSRTDPAEPGHVVCDLGAASLLAAAGVTALLEVDAYARRRGARFSVTAPPGPARRVLELTGTSTLLDMPYDAGPAEQRSDAVGNSLPDPTGVGRRRSGPGDGAPHRGGLDERRPEVHVERSGPAPS